MSLIQAQDYSSLGPQTAVGGTTLDKLWVRQQMTGRTGVAAAVVPPSRLDCSATVAVKAGAGAR